MAGCPVLAADAVELQEAEATRENSMAPFVP